MNTTIYRHAIYPAVMLAALLSSCERDIDTDVIATAPCTAEVFVDGFAAGLEFQAWGNPTNLTIDTESKYSGTTSLRIAVPEPGDLAGSWAGGTFYTQAGRDLTRYNCLTFYARSSTGTAIEVGIGNYGDDPQYVVSMKNVKIDSNWHRYIIPIPNAAKLTCEKGLFYYSAGAVDGSGYTIWIDDVRFEYIGTLAHTRIQDMTMPGFPAGDFEISNLECAVNLPNGIYQPITASSRYFTFTSSNPEVATVTGNMVTFHGGKGETVLRPVEAEGSITITDVYDYAPRPTLPASDVLSVFSDEYPTVGAPIFNNYWGYQTTTDDMIDAGGQHMIHYGDFNFVGIVFQQDIDCSAMDFVHMDVLLMSKTDGETVITVTPHTASGAVGYEGRAVLRTGEWVSIDVPLDPTVNPVHELVLASGNGEDILVDNIYFYKK